LQPAAADFHVVQETLASSAWGLGARAPLDFQQFIFFVAIKVRRQSLTSNVFMILSSSVIKISLFFILLKKMKG